MTLRPSRKVFLWLELLDVWGERVDPLSQPRNPLDHIAHLVADNQAVAEVFVGEALVDAIGQQGDEWVPVAFEIQETDGFGVALQL